MKQGKNSQFLFTALLAASFLPFLLSSCSKPETVVVEPVEIDDVLVNPGMGFTTFYSLNNDKINANHPEGSIAYYRWYWEVLEPEEGRVNFAMIDSILAICREKGQKLAFRVMCQNGHEMADKSVTEKWEVPDWFRNSGVAGCTYENGRGWQPDYDSSFFLEKHGNLLRALGARYDGHPDLDHVDIGSVGRWGEWHTSRTGCPMPTEENMARIVDLYVDNFSKTPLVMNIDGGPARFPKALAGGPTAWETCARWAELKTGTTCISPIPRRWKSTAWARPGNMRRWLWKPAGTCFTGKSRGGMWTISLIRRWSGTSRYSITNLSPYRSSGRPK